MALQSMDLAYSPSQLAGLFPGANTGGTSLGGFPSGTPVNSGVTFGGATNPAVPSLPTGQAVAPSTSTAASPAPASSTIQSSTMPAGTTDPYAPTGTTAALAGLSGSGAASTTDSQKGITQALEKGGYSSGIAGMLAQFILNGSGYNPQVAQALIAAMQPQIASGAANLMEQFGSEGLAMSSPAALGLGNYYSTTNLDVGTLLSNLYETSVNDYLGILEGGLKSQPSTVLGDISSLLGGLGGGSGISDLLGSI